MFVKIPFQFIDGNVAQETDVKKSLDQFIDALVATPTGHCKSAPDFGFVFKKYSFENFDEKKRTIAYLSNEEPLRDYKIAGTSKNQRNFAYELKRIIETYEPRLRVNDVTMDYDTERHNVKLSILGELDGVKPQPYSHDINFNVW